MSLEPRPGPRPSLQRLFLTGLLTLLPIWLTWVVVKFVFVLLSGISSPVVPLSEQIATSFPHYLGWVRAEWIQDTIALLATLLVILAVGVASRRVLGQRCCAGSARSSSVFRWPASSTTAPRSCWTCCRPNRAAPSAWC